MSANDTADTPRATGGFLSWRRTPVAVNFDDLPTPVEVAQGHRPLIVDLSFWWLIKSLEFLLLFVFTGLVGSQIFNVLADSRASQSGWESTTYSVLFIIAVVPVTCIVLRIIAQFKRAQFSFTTDGVGLSKVGFFRRNVWWTPSSAYNAVQYRRESDYGSFWPIHIIELVNADPARTVPLYVQAGAEVPRERWKAYAMRLGLPALQKAGAEIVERIDGSTAPAIKDRISSDFPALADVPSNEIFVTQDEIDGEPATRIELTPRWWHCFRLLAVVTASLLSVALVGLFVFSSWAMAGWAMGANILFSILLVLAVNRRAILVSRKSLVVVDKTPLRNPTSRRFKLAELEDVGIRAQEWPAIRFLSVADSREQIVISQDLRDDALEWLRDYILAAATRA